MSTDIAISKEEKKRLKEEKRARKAAKAAAEPTAVAIDGEASNTAAGAVVDVAADTSSKKDKKDKKRKRAEGESGDVESAERSDKKEKKDKKKKEKRADNGVTPSTVESTPIATPAESSSTSITEEPLSKKALKKLAKAAAASTSTAAAQLVQPSSFTGEHNAYLKTHNITLLPPLYPPHLTIPTLPIPAPLLQYLTKFPSPTPIQACSWPALLGGRDVVGIAETGSGKTLAFGVPALNHLSSRAGGQEAKKGRGLKGNIGVLVLAPTRELAQQSHENLSLAGKSMGIESTCIFGGVPKDPQTRDLARKEVRIVVGTPGRTLDLANQGDLDLSKWVVFDHRSLFASLTVASRTWSSMKRTGCSTKVSRTTSDRSLRTAQATSQAGRRSCVGDFFFIFRPTLIIVSATWPESVRRLASTFLKDPIRVTVGSDELSANKRIEQIVEVLDDPRGKE